MEKTYKERFKLFIRKYGMPIIFLAPLIIVLAIFLLYPILRAARMSFSYWYIARPIPEGNPFIGLENYREVISSYRFRNSVFVTSIYIVVTVAARYVIGLFGAILLNKKFRGRSIARSLMVLPWAIPVVVACLLFVLIYNPEIGILNYILMRLGIIESSIAFLGDINWALPSAMLVNIWKGFPWALIMLLAGLQSIPEIMYESAEVDGANWWHKFRHITLPLLRPVSAIVFVLLVIWTVRDFAILYVLTGGGPANATEILTVFIYRTGFRSFRMGRAAAGGMILLGVSLIFTVVYMKISGGEEQTW